MSFKTLRTLVARIYQTSKEQYPCRRKQAAITLGRVVVGAIVLKDKSLGTILRGFLR